MADFGSLKERIAVHNVSLPSLTDGQNDTLQLDSTGRLLITTSGVTVDVEATDLDIRDLTAASDSVSISDGSDTLAINPDGSLNAVLTSGINVEVDLDHADDSVKVGDGTDLLGIYGAGESFSGNTGLASLVAVRDDALSTLSEADGTLTHLRVNDQGELYITGDITANAYEPGTEADTRADETDGVVQVDNTSFTTVATLSIGDGVTGYLVGMNVASNESIDWRIITNDSATVLRRGACPAGDTCGLTFPRAIEIPGSGTETVELQAKTLNDVANAQVGGALNIYTK